MENKNRFDVIIVGGSYSGLAAAMALGRALRKVLIIDSGKPCNEQTPHSHNFITQDGKKPAEISAIAKEQVLKYETVQFHNGLAITGSKTDKGFEIITQSGEKFTSKKLLFATGIKDLIPNIDGFSECWGISIIHCPYCHGYEVRYEKTGILGNGDYGFEFSKMIHNWTKELTLYTNGKSTLTEEQSQKLKIHNIQIIETEIEKFEHKNGQIESIVFKDRSKTAIKAIYARPPFEQHCTIPTELGCEINEQGYFQVDAFQKTTIPGIYASGDNTTPMRSLANAVAAGTLAGVMMNREIIDEEF
jgi:thioredoxin reductase